MNSAIDKQQSCLDENPQNPILAEFLNSGVQLAIEQDRKGPLHDMAYEQDSKENIVDIPLGEVLAQIQKQLPCALGIMSRVYNAIECEHYEKAERYLESINKNLTTAAIGPVETGTPLYDPDGGEHERVLTADSLAPIVAEISSLFREIVISKHEGDMLAGRIRAQVLSDFEEIDKDHSKYETS